MRNKKKFNEFMNKTIEELKDEKRYGTAHVYQSTLNAFCEFCGCKIVYFHQLNRATLKEFETHLRDKQLSWNTVSTYMRTLRGAYNKAVDQKITTGGQMIVDIPPTAMELIRQYQNTDCNSPYLFPILSGTKTGEELYIEYQQALRIMNYNLGRLARRCGVITKVSSYTTRHTWATLAKYCNFSEQLICEAFGHSSVKVTETYLKNFKYEEIKKANDAIILYVSKNGKKRA